MPDIRTDEIESFGQGDSGCSRFVMRGSLTGAQSAWPVESKGQAFEADYIVVWHLRGEQIKELWLSTDRLALMRQLGAIPPSR